MSADEILGEIQFEDRMSGADALMWNIEKDPALRSTITTVLTLDKAVNRERLVEKFDRLGRVFPRLRQRVRGNPYSIAPPRWEYDPNFDLHFHLWWIKAPGKGTERDLLSVAEPIAMSGFDRARPLWRAVVVEGLKGGRSAIIMKIHHAVTDGVGGMKLQLELLDAEPNAPQEPMPREPEIHVLSQPERVADALDHQAKRGLNTLRHTVTGIAGGITGAVTNPAGTIRNSAELASSVARVLGPATHPLSPLMTGRSLSCRFDTITIPMDQAKQAAKVAGGKLNDAFVGGLARGIYHYHMSHGVDCDELRMAIPISVRKPENENVAGNSFIPARVILPIDCLDAIDSMRQVKLVVDGAKHEPANDIVDPTANLLNRLPTSAVTALFGSMVKTVDFTASNVPGPPFPIYLADAQIESQFPFGPLAGNALNVTLLSYQNDLNIGINTDPASVPDPDKLMECIQQGYDEILAVGK